MSGRLNGKVALVTGSSGGIGSCICEALAEAGCRLALHYSSNHKTAQTLKNRLRHSDCRLLREDLLKPGAAERLVRRTLAAFGRLDILVNNAGAVLGDKPYLEMTPQDWSRTMRLNAEAPFFAARQAMKSMARQGGGRVINISSVAAKFGGSARSMHYGAAKAALEALTVGLAREGAPDGILVNAVRAGVIDTPFHGKFRKDMGRRAALIPLRRLGRPQDVARMVLHLASEGGDFITGQILPVTGGE